MIHKEKYDMNYIKAKKLLLKHYKKKLVFEEKEGEGKVNLVAKGVKFGAFDDDVRMEFTFKEDGVATVTFVFDTLEPTQSNLALVNAYNDNIGFLKAYITERNGHHFFAIEYYLFEALNEKNAVNTLISMVKMLTGDRSKQFLLPILNLTR